MNFHQFVAIMAARWRVALGVFLACLAVSQVISLRSPKLYTAKASMVVDAKDPVPGANQGTQPKLIQTQIEIITSAAVADRVVEDLGLDRNPAMQTGWHESTGGKGDFKGWLASGLLNSIAVPPPLESNVVNVYATWSDPVWAAKIANAFAEAYVKVSIEQNLEADIAAQTNLSNASLLTKATEPVTPSSPKYRINFAIGLLSGLALGIATVLGLENIDQRVRRDEELPLLLGVPLLTTFRATQAGPAMWAVAMLKSVASRALGVRDIATKALGWSR